MNTTKAKIWQLVRNSIGWTVIVFCLYLMADFVISVQKLPFRSSQDFWEGLIFLAFLAAIAMLVAWDLDRAQAAFNKSLAPVKE